MIVLEIKLLDRRSAHFEIEIAADSEHGITNDFGVEACAIHAPEETIVAVDLRVFGIVSRTLAIGSGREEKPMQGLDGFTIVQEPKREPIEQFRMCGRRTHLAEIVRCVHEA